MIPLAWAAGTSFAGLWVGDLALYFLALWLGRPLLDNRWFKRVLGKVDLRQSEAWFRDHGATAIIISRAIPGTRLPTYLAAGLTRLPAIRFISITGMACFVWVGLLFWLSYHAGMMVIDAFKMFRSEAGKLAACVVLALILGWLLRKVCHRVRWTSMVAKIRKMRHWEFWPMGLFYVPVVLKYLTLAIRYRSLSLPAVANPGMHTGGLVGESKFDTLADLEKAKPEFVAQTYLVKDDNNQSAQKRVRDIRESGKLEFPNVFKPDVGQRGEGFKIVRSEADEQAYIERFRGDFLVQKYVPGPYEIGAFYYRFPHEAKGKIFAITEKVFPKVIGDGMRTLEELIRADARASIVAGTYLERFASTKGRVLAVGETVQLVEAGNHLQGAIFLDGAHLFSDELEGTIDTISRSIEGFYVGRYDLRYSSEEALRLGRDFQIIELNGISSEATSIYDPKHTLLHAYQTLFRQWEIIFAIADENRKRGMAVSGVKPIFESWRRARRLASQYTVSD